MKPATRHKARILALQAIYQWQLNCTSVTDLETQFCNKLNPKKVDVTYFYTLVRGVLNNIIKLDTIITPSLDRPLKNLDEIAHALLRLATYELTERQDIPHKVILNEALELAKNFGASEEYKYINGVLDKIAHTVRNLAAV